MTHSIAFLVLVLVQSARLWGASCCSQEEALGEFLYARLHLGDCDYAIEDPRSFVGINEAMVGPLGTFLPFGKALSVSPDHEPAFGVGIHYLGAGRCQGIGLFYSRVFNADQRGVVAPGEGGVWVTHAHPRFNGLRLNNALITNGFGNLNTVEPIPEASAVLRVRQSINTVDGYGIAQTMASSALWLRAQVGLRWALIDSELDLNYEGITAQQSVLGAGPDPATLLQNAQLEVADHNQTWGIGPRFGCTIRYGLGCGFGLGARLGAAICLGASTCHLRQHVVLEGLIQGVTQPANVDEELDVHRSDGCHLFPQWDARLGLNYTICCGEWFAVCGEVGWEFLSYVSALKRLRFNDVGGTGRWVGESLNVDGLYLSLRVTL